MATFSFDASSIAPAANFSPVPAGSYISQIIDSSIGATKDMTGQILKLTFEIIDGEFKGRKIWNNLNIQNKNADTQKYAQADLSAICRATNQIKLEDTAALHGIPLKIKVTIREASGGYEAQNQIKGFDAASGGLTSQPTPSQPAPGMTQGAANPSKPAWAK